MPTPTLKSLTPVLIVERVEPCLAFWTDRLGGVPFTKPRHQTFYGSTEFYVREPGGNVVGFAAF